MGAVSTRKISTSSLARKLELSAKELFSRMESSGWIVREGESWSLTEKGKAKGGEITKHPRYGVYIVWPDVLDISNSDDNPAKEGKAQPSVVSASAIGKLVELSAQKVNAIFSELGWITKAL